MSDDDRTWLKSLPLLLSAAFLMIAGAYAFFNAEDQIASVAAFASALILLGVWIGTVVVDHDHSIHHKKKDKDENPP